EGGSEGGPKRTAQAQPPSGWLGPRPRSRGGGRGHPPPSGSQQHGPGGRSPPPEAATVLSYRIPEVLLRAPETLPRISSALQLAFRVRRRSERPKPRARTPGQMPVAVGPYGQSQPSCFDRVKMGFVMGCAVGMAAGALFGTFSCLRIGMRGRELMGGIGKTMMQSGGTFGTFMAIGMGIRC
uniref:Reactive oxygen species modulator 1 n=1 Tax=Capra hircus TaxID=9925 RepID=A0A8C2SET9_CAPHI